MRSQSITWQGRVICSRRCRGSSEGRRLCSTGVRTFRLVRRSSRGAGRPASAPPPQQLGDPIGPDNAAHDDTMIGSYENVWGPMQRSKARTVFVCIQRHVIALGGVKSVILYPETR